MTNRTLEPKTQSDADLEIPGHLARYAAEVDQWRAEAFAYRAAQAFAQGPRR